MCGVPKTASAHFGGKSVFLGRFTAALRALVPGLAGMSRLRYRRFVAWNALGGLIWACLFVVLGYLAGSRYQQIEHYANYLGIGLLVAIAGIVYLRHRRTGAHQACGADSGESPMRRKTQSHLPRACVRVPHGSGVRARKRVGVGGYCQRPVPGLWSC